MEDKTKPPPGHYIDRSTIISDMLQGFNWNGTPVTGSYRTDDEVITALWDMQARCWQRAMDRKLEAKLYQGRLIDEDPVPEGYYVESSDEGCWNACTGFTAHCPPPAVAENFPTCKAAIRWCWAHSQGLVE